MKRDVVGSEPSPGKMSPGERGRPGPRGGWWILGTLSFGSVMGTMSNTIVNTTLPLIRESFGADLSSVRPKKPVELQLLHPLPR